MGLWKWLFGPKGGAPVKPTENPYAALMAALPIEEIARRKKEEYERLGLEARARETILETLGGPISLCDGATRSAEVDERLARLFEKVEQAYEHLPTDPELRRKILELRAAISLCRPDDISTICRQLFQDGRTSSLWMPRPLTHKDDFVEEVVADGGHWEPVYPLRIIRWEKVDRAWSGTFREPVYEEMFVSDFVSAGIRWKPWGGALLKAIASELEKRRKRARQAAEKAAAARRREEELAALDPEVRELLDHTRGPNPRPSH